ncbi:MAG: hypothetical protein RR867_01055 [Ruthenibacterium sp.]
MRTQKSIVNFSVALAGQIIALIVSIIARTVFLQFLNAEYLGLASLFTNVLTMLSLVELGIGPAMSFSLYRPLAQNDVEKIKSLMRLYRRAYTIIGIVVLVLGVCFTPFYRLLIAQTPDIPHLDFIYLLFVANTGVSYFFAYKRALVMSDQNRYIATIFRYAFYIILNTAQIFVLCLTQNYILFLALQIMSTILENISLSYKVTKMYPYLKEKTVKKLTTEDLTGIRKNVGAMLLHKIGSLVVNSTDSIIIAKFVGLAAGGLYSNYQLVLTALNAFIYNVFDSITAGIGDLNAQHETKKMEIVFWRVFFADFCIYGFCSICLAVLFAPFISLFFGAKYLLDIGTTSVLIVNFFLAGMRMSALSFREATGAYYYDRYKPLFESVINLAVSIYLVQKIGIMGVFVGTGVSMLTTCFWIEPYVVFKHVLKIPLRRYFLRYGCYTVIGIAIGAVTVGVATLLPATGFLAFVARMLLCIAVPLPLFWLVFHRTPEYSYYLELAQGLLHKIKSKQK